MHAFYGMQSFGLMVVTSMSFVACRAPSNSASSRLVYSLHAQATLYVNWRGARGQFTGDQFTRELENPRLCDNSALIQEVSLAESTCSIGIPCM